MSRYIYMYVLFKKVMTICRAILVRSGTLLKKIIKNLIPCHKLNKKLLNYILKNDIFLISDTFLRRSTTKLLLKYFLTKTVNSDLKKQSKQIKNKHLKRIFKIFDWYHIFQMLSNQIQILPRNKPLESKQVLQMIRLAHVFVDKMYWK